MSDIYKNLGCEQFQFIDDSKETNTKLPTLPKFPKFPKFPIKEFKEINEIRETK